MHVLPPHPAGLRPLPHVTRRFHFADAYWFRLPLRATVISLAVFALMWLYPAFGAASFADQGRLALALGMLVWFMGLASIFIVSVNDSYVDIGNESIEVTFESFFRARLPLDGIVSVALISPRPRWRYRFGLSTNFKDRISCSHGGQLIEIVMARPQTTKLWPRRIAATRFWLGVRESDEFLAALRCAVPHAFQLGLRAAA